MRVAYLALTGYVVDIFSAKDSLSKRDHNDFSHFLTALKIPHAYIKSKSNASAYQNESKEGIGGVNYATIGNISLFHTNRTWKGNAVCDLEAKNNLGTVSWVGNWRFERRFDEGRSTLHSHHTRTHPRGTRNMDLMAV